MKEYIIRDPWKIIENDFNPAYHEISESLFSIGNGRFGQRANFEEKYSGETLQGSYVAGVYYPDKTRVGWWKNGYPEYFAKVLNSVNWIGIDVELDTIPLDLNTWKVHEFNRTLDMKTGLLSRSFKASNSANTVVKVKSERFCSMADQNIAAIKYSITLEKESAVLNIRPYLDGKVVNKDSNYDEIFWEEQDQNIEERRGYVQTKTKKTGFVVHAAMNCDIAINGSAVEEPTFQYESSMYVGSSVDLNLEEGDTVTVTKYVSVLSSRNYETSQLIEVGYTKVDEAKTKGYDALREAHENHWGHIWSTSDIIIEGDIAAQQGIRFNIFQLNQTYTGDDERLNIGPKGFTGEKYGGSTYWDTEAYCLPFYLATADPHVSKNLLVYRYKHLGKAIENAEKLGFRNGAALYPMVTMNGEECHNEWEITFEEIHRNGAIAFAIYDYVRYTGDRSYLEEYGIEVLVGISRFWAQRFHLSERRQQYVMHGVTGPNEYENNVNNNWYTSRIALWTLEYTMSAINELKEKSPDLFAQKEDKLKFHYYTETNHWKDILSRTYLPEDEELGIFLQQEGYLDKEQLMADEIPNSEVPIWQHWSWDRILRSCFIKQADVLQGIYLLDDLYEDEVVKRNFEYYEPRTVHESSLSPCVHVILAARLNKMEKAYELYLRTSRLDLDDYNNDTEDGLHITSMAGTWMSIVKGFGGMRTVDGKMSFNPKLPEAWDSYSFHVIFRGVTILVHISKQGTQIKNLSDTSVDILIDGQRYSIEPDSMALA
ncbi:MAG: glycoside hydrolase family 65 protein [Bacteroidia bacterium]|nr:glycoside hydrolase family 65 protein [Bacteroidia bacterium]